MGASFVLAVLVDMSSESDKEDKEDEENARPQQQGGSIFSQPDVSGLGYRAAFAGHAGSTEAKQAASKAHASVGDEADAISGSAKNDGECPRDSTPVSP